MLIPIFNPNFQTLMLAKRINNFSLKAFDVSNKSVIRKLKIEKNNRAIIEMSAFLLSRVLLKFDCFLFSFIRAKLKNKMAKNKEKIKN
jgi:hypothetical protein